MKVRDMPDEASRPAPGRRTARVRLVAALIAAAVVAGCAAQRFDPRPQLAPSLALPEQPSDFLEPVEAAITSEGGADVSGFHLLDANEDGLRWRLALVDSARRSIDVQYYLWYGDSSGLLLTKRLLDAADRGVRVRMLVDDVNTLLRDASTVKLRDRGAALLDAHPNIELRLFNPWSSKRLAGRAGEAATDLKRLNQRMHHKAMIVDNRAVIVGGRNVGDEYFGLNEQFNFHDLDVLGVGPVARDVSGVFDAFWNSEWAWPASALAIEITEAAGDQARSALLAELAARPAIGRFPLEPEDWTAEFAALAARLHPGKSEVLTDVPAAGEIAHEMTEAMYRLLASVERELLVINAYIIPSARTLDGVRALTGAGASVAILTNSLASHDVPAVNSHYKQSRREILESGARLFETRPDAAIQPQVSDTPPVRARFMGLHSKAMVVDRERAYVGSMNFDPRSSAINTEMGVVIDSPGLARELARLIERDMQAVNSWEVVLDDSDRLRWVSGDEILSRQPARNWWQRVQDAFFMLFPKSLY